MEDFDTVKKNLEDRGYAVRVFSTGAEAAAYLDGVIDGRTVGFGGSLTLEQLGLYDALGRHNTVVWHWKQEAGPARREAMQTDIYLTSANGLAETGEILNIDGIGNRVAATLFGHEKVYFPPMKKRCGGPGTSPRRKMPGGWGKRPPVPSRGTAAMTAKARSGSAAAW